MAKEVKDGIAVFHAKSRKDWRTWLEKNHDKVQSVWLIFYRKGSDVPCVEYIDAVEEALCFGWIDSKTIKRDEQSRYQYFAKRKAKGNWSKSNKERVARLIEQGLMTPAGLKIIETAKQNGAWEALDEIEAISVPPDLQKRFSKNKKALKYWENFPPSSKKIILGWIASARRPETRQKRIDETVRLAGENMRANHP